ncbi:biotin--[acetyl-CoA-carboxylase] ligase [Christiangramia portivictoriae]|uniref:biotin--[acetyl-CoA-carboxylase] ligase n=1 Tax=Christiangramia portivictoriae TaxID=326069 RepID=UPI0003FBDB03|nr:biotin--[acetyl-CoA-carboxylase] ligase [Christiangramia portivictoriae]
MRIIKVNAIDSTNTFVRKFYDNNGQFEPVCVSAAHQTNGRGQRGANWNVQPGQNLTFSILYPQQDLNISGYFKLNICISLAILEVLAAKNLPQLKVKWPNDIMSQRKKLGGILIENIVKTEGIVASIIGIGINVNQTNFNELPQATSLKNVTGIHWSVDDLLHELCEILDLRLRSIGVMDTKELMENYENHLFRKDVISTFQVNEDKFNGIIRGVTSEGKLQVEKEEQVFQTFDLKEIKLLY